MDAEIEVIERELRAYNYIIKCAQLRTARALHHIHMMQMAYLCVCSGVFGAIIWNLILEWAGRL